MKLPFTKMHGAGNDFVVVDDRKGDVPWQDSERMRRIGTRRLGIGCEGFIFIRNEDAGMKNGERCDFRMLFLNPDGSEAAMCGNGARCAAFFAYAKGIAGRSQRIQTGAGIVEAEIVEACDDTATVRIAVPDPAPPVEKCIVAEGREWACQCLDTGVFHAVVFVDDVEAVDVPKIGRAIRNHPAFAPEGVNVNFVQHAGSASPPCDAKHDGTSCATLLRIRTYERGVEDESGACGTGSIAAAVIAGLKTDNCKLTTVNCKLITSSGDTLLVERPRGKGLTLTGPSVIVFHGEIIF